MKLNLKPFRITTRTPAKTLWQVADSPSFPDGLRFEALLELCRRTGFKPRPAPSMFEVLRRVVTDERVPIELRADAASALLAGQPPAIH